MRKKQNGGWKLSDTDWFYFSFYNPSCFFLWSELIRVQFYFIFIFLLDPSWSEWIRVDQTRTGGPSWSGPTFVPACFSGLNAPCTTFTGQSYPFLILLTKKKHQSHLFHHNIQHHQEIPNINCSFVVLIFDIFCLSKPVSSTMIHHLLLMHSG